MTPAAKLQKYLRARVEASGGFYRKLRWEGRDGAPDCFIWWHAKQPRCAFIEVKAGEDRVTTLQNVEMTRLASGGFPVFVVRSTDDIDAALGSLR